MDIKLDKNSPIPIGVQVKEQIKMLVNSGSYNEGDKLPSINQLAAVLCVNKNTVVTILKELEKEAYIHSHRGKGIFISKKDLGKKIDKDFISKVDLIINEARNCGVTLSELLNIISARFSESPVKKNLRVLFMVGIGKQLMDINVKKLRDNIPGAEVKGLFICSELTKEEAENAFGWSNLLIIPSAFYEYAADFLPKDKPIIKTKANLSLLAKLKKGTEKKSKIAVISALHRGSEIMAEMFISGNIFRPKLIIGLDELDKTKKDLKEIDSLVVCESAKEVVEKLKHKLKDKNIYYFSDYIDDESMREIKEFCIQ